MMDDLAKSNRSDWTKVAFGDVVAKVNDNIQDILNCGLSEYVRGEHFETGNLRLIGRSQLCDGLHGSAFDKRFKPGDVLYVSRNPHLNKVAVADFEGVCANTTYVCRAKDRHMLQEFLPILMQTPSFVEHTIRNKRGSTNPYLNWSDIENYEFNLPPLQEQARIVEAFRGFQAYENSLRDCELRSNSLVLSLLNDTWVSSTQRISLGHLIEDGPKNGLYKPASDYGSGTRIVRIDTFDNGLLLNQICWKRLKADQKEREEFSLREDDVLINRVNSREYVGQCALVPQLTEIAVFESNIMRLRLNQNDVIPSLVAAQINHPQARRQIAQLRKDAVNQSSVNQADVKSLELPNLSIGKQKELAGALARLHLVRKETLRRVEQSRRLSRFAAEQSLRAATTDDI